MRLFFRLCIILTLLTTAAGITAAQETIPYVWQDAGISLNYPAGWDAPLPDSESGPLTLHLAQVLVDMPPEVRPPAVPTITLRLLPDSLPPDEDLLPFLLDALQTLGIEAEPEPGEAALLDAAALQLTGTSADNQFSGVARAAAAGNDVLVVAGRAASAQRDDFLAIFDAVASSVALAEPRPDETAEAEAETDPSSYGVLWHTQRTQADAENAFLNLVGLAYGPADRLFTYESDLGVVQIDAITGAVLSITPNDSITEPADLAVAPDGTVYVADTACSCVFALGPDGAWVGQIVTDEATDEADEDTETAAPVEVAPYIADFGPGAPAQLAVGPDGMLYASNVTSTSTITVLAFEGRNRIQEIRLEEDLFEQPLLSTAPSGQVYALTQFGELLELRSGEAVLASTPGPFAEAVTDMAVGPDSSLILATEHQGLLVVTSEGELVDQPGSIVPAFPLPGEMVAPVGVTADAQGRLYFADSDGSFGAVTAMSTQVAPDRLGSASLMPGLGVQGIVSAQTPQQAWTYNATAGEHITLTAIDLTGALDLALRLIDPTGAEVAFNDDHESQDLINFTDAQIYNQPLAHNGEYIIMVEAVSGEGTYSLGLSQTRPLTFGADGVARESGTLSAAFPADLWTFDGTEDQTLTITLETTEGDLDPLVRLYGPDGSLVDENDDAEDFALGSSAQLSSLVLPASGLYRLEAARFDGAGSYSLTVVSTGG